ncbi:hypothetical protein SNE40_017071 [Patella caerulea]
MSRLDPAGLRNRTVGVKVKKTKDCFVSKGPNWVHSIDGHDKLMGYQNSTFPLAIYGCLDTASRKLLWLRIWTSNSDPQRIGKWYYEHLCETKQMSTYLRMDKGTETGVIATMHSYLHQHHNIHEDEPTDTVIYGPSTSNQIERWWKELHERLEKYYKRKLLFLKEEGHYNPHTETDRYILAFVFIPILQRELDTFKEVIWNSHRIRCQKNTVLPHGIPNHIYSFPDKYDLEECGWIVNDDQLDEIFNHAKLDNVADDFLEADFRAKCEAIIPATENISPEDCVEAYIYIKQNFKV